jgi:hypothetical protein
MTKSEDEKFRYSFQSQDWLAEGQENRRVVTTRVRVCGVELSTMQRSYGGEQNSFRHGHRESVSQHNFQRAIPGCQHSQNSIGLSRRTGVNAGQSRR